MRGFVCQSIHWSVGPFVRPSGKTSGLDACVWGLGLGRGWGLDASLSNRETHVESGTNQKDAQRKKRQSTRQNTITKNSKKHRTYDFFPTTRAAFIGTLQKNDFKSC